MRFLNPLWLGAIYGLSELYLAFTRQSDRASSRDRGSLLVLWIVIAISIFLAVQAVWIVPGATVRSPIPFYIFGLILFLFGLALRWFSIGYLGRDFTVNVAVNPEQTVIHSGPYRYIRHPSYTGALLAFVGFGCSLCNWLSILFLTVPIVAAFLWRIHVEEQALLEALGDNYADYMRTTSRLVPWLY
jgi:protein-S-isoprenylcysteine O-methyltransferase Ste14